MKKSAKRGRPPVGDETRDSVLPPIRCSSAEKAHWQDSAAAKGETLSEAVRLLLRRRYGRPPSP